MTVEDAVNNDLLSNPGNWRPSQFLGDHQTYRRQIADD